ncbi:MAG TPA: phage virion morphogenesis protein [Solirubrobacterales bacterium]|nr:phage virion morphogenesis protein [Solirubrobacterales bacterium]
MTPTGFAFRSGPYTELDVAGIAAARGDLAGISRRAEDMRPAMVVVREMLKQGNEDVFESKGAAIGEPWPELNPSTIKRKSREGIPSLSDILVAGGDLEAAAHGGAGSRGSARRASASAGIGKPAWYARFHLSGARGGQMPPRPPVGIPADTEASSVIAIERYLIHGGF